MRSLQLAAGALLFGLLLVLPACSLLGGRDDSSSKPLFKPGEYGGDPLPGAEALNSLKPSHDGTRIALVREKTPNNQLDPRNQLWIVDRDGSNPRLISVNTRSVDWSPDDKKLAVTVTFGLSAYIYTIDLETLTTQQWNGREDQRIDRPNASNPIWFEDGHRLLVSVVTKGYQQTYERGTYIIDTRTGQTTGPLLELMQAAFLGGNDQYVTGRKYSFDGENTGNFATYFLKTGQWQWITNFSHEALDFVYVPVPSPTGDLLVQGRRVDHAEQMFLMDKYGENVRQITQLGGDYGLWSYDGRQIFFRRDLHKGEGARYVPFVYDLDSGTEAVLWPHLPDSLPVFPDLTTQTIQSLQ